jgi:D-sedoheptulose 7-phosphate isomerase
MAEAVNRIMALARRTHAAGNKLIFVGNGGSSAIASHMATDYSKNGDARAMALNDTAMLTCPGNDLGFCGLRVPEGMLPAGATAA